MSDSAVGRLDPQNPWPGLRSFTEADSAYFFGRERETQALLEIVARSSVAVLYGQSGLGKTSLLRAGLFPPLAAAGHLPVWVRLDQAGTAAPLARQVLDALMQAFAQHDVEAPAPRDDESLWSYFHRHDADFWGARNRLVLPVIVLDQFEELFTLGRRDAAAIARTEQFARELEAQFEQRPPAAVRERLERYPEDAAAYDPAREAVRFIISLREDYLPHLDAWRERMPSMLAHRFRLEQMNGVQALEVVKRAGSALVDDAVARDIVAFVASSGAGTGTAAATALAQARVEPAILSVVCDELNARRVKAGLPNITPELLSGERGRIIGDFYERAFDGIADPVRDWVEDELLTDSGHRDRAALEDARRAGIDADAIMRLIDRRVLHSDERNQVVWVELTHDLLTEPALASRNARQLRRAEAETAHRSAETAAKLRTSHALTAVFLVMFLLMSVVGGMFWMQLKKAEASEANANAAARAAQIAEQHAQAETARAKSAGAEALASDQHAQAETARATSAGEVATRKAAEAQANLDLAMNKAQELARQGADELESEWLHPGYNSAEVVQAATRNILGAQAQQLASDPSMFGLALRSLALAALVHHDRGDAAQCSRYATQADAMARGAPAASGAVTLALALNHYANGQCLRLRGQPVQAAQRFRQATQMALHARSAAPAWPSHRLLVLSTLGQVRAAVMRYDFERARSELREAQALIERPPAAIPAAATAQAEEAAAWRVTALKAQAEMATSKAEQTAQYGRVKNLIDELPGALRETPAWRYRAVDGEVSRAYALLYAGRVADADEIVDTALDTLGGLVSGDPRHTQWRLTQIRARRLRGEISQKWGRDELAAGQLSRVFEEAKAIAEGEPTSASARYTHGMAAWLQTKLKGADAKTQHERLEGAERIFGALVHDAPQYGEAARSLAIVRLELGNLLLGELDNDKRDRQLDRRRVDDADAYYLQGLRAVEGLKQAMTVASIADLQGDIETRRAVAADQRGDFQQALQAYERAVAYYRVVPVTAQNRAERALAVTYPSMSIARLQRKSQRPERAAATDDASLKLLAAARRDEPDRVDLLQQITSVHRRAAGDHLGNGDFAGAIREENQAAEAMLDALRIDPLNHSVSMTLDEIRKWVGETLRKKIDETSPQDKGDLLTAVGALVARSDTARSMRPAGAMVGAIAPALPGDWEHLGPAAMRLEPYRLVPEIERLKATGWAVQRARRLALPFYAGAYLVEFDGRDTGREIGVASFLLDGQGVAFRLNGDVEPLKKYNATHEINLRSIEQARQYMRFYLAALREGKSNSMYRLVDHPRDLVWLPGLPDTAESMRAGAENLIEPFEVSKSASGDWTAQATIQLGTELVSAKLHLSRDGALVHFGIRTVMQNLTLVSETYSNGIRVRRLASGLAMKVRELRLRKDWPGAAGAQEQVIADLSRHLSTDKERRDELPREYLRLSWYWLLAREAARALDAANNGLKIDADDLALQMNGAHALLLLGRTVEAMDVYRRPLGKPVSGSEKRLWEAVVLEDLDDFEKEGLTHPRFADVRALMKAGGN